MLDTTRPKRTSRPKSGPFLSVKLRLGGRVQGVGFRPFVYRLAHLYRLSGWVKNLAGEVEIAATGTSELLAEFEKALLADAPPLAQPYIVFRETMKAREFDSFKIFPSKEGAASSVHVPPDYFTCDDCLRELHDPNNRRYRYPFINCTQCGPRYTLIKTLPYDRWNTTMAVFELCADCRQEYENPLDRRFHAEPIACSVCGPQLRFDSGNLEIADDTQASLTACVAALRKGKIVAVKGVGGYHLMCNASNDDAVERLRAAKPRPHKPLAVMFPVTGEDGLDAVRAAAKLTTEHENALFDPMRPIVLVEKRPDSSLSSGIAPRLNEIGAMLPYSPLHHLLLEDFDGPLVATSANVSGEPMLTDSEDIKSRLAQVADAYLHHDRPIQRPADDPVYRVIDGRCRPLRLGRGNAPLELDLPSALSKPVLAVGGHMKNTVALAWRDRAVISPHIGDLDTPRALAVFEQTIEDLQALYGVRAEHVVHDAHPAYVSTRWAERSGLPVAKVYHHFAHASAVAGEHPDVKHWLVFAWDGVGYGYDGGLWGGEALAGKPGQWRRMASFRPFRLPGGEKVGREPWRSAQGLCWENKSEWTSCPVESSLLEHAWRRRLNSPLTTSVGRLFDAASALLGLCHQASFEGQGPMYLETVCAGTADPVALPLQQNGRGLWITDWAPLLALLFDERLSLPERSAAFHTTLAQALLEQALAVRNAIGEVAIGLTGGVFQNRILSEYAVTLLKEHGFDVRQATQVPCNDAGISYGQIIEVSRLGFRVSG